jgi:hypothetical protein
MPLLALHGYLQTLLLKVEVLDAPGGEKGASLCWMIERDSTYRYWESACVASGRGCLSL